MIRTAISPRLAIRIFWSKGRPPIGGHIVTGMPDGSAKPGVGAHRFLDVRRFDSIDSTNRYLLDEARSGAPEGLVAVADSQEAGRGRLGRTWVAPPGSSLLVSVLLRPGAALPQSSSHLLTVAPALAAAARVGPAETTGAAEPAERVRERARRELASEYRRRCSTVGRAVRVELPDETFTGTAVDISEQGQLMVDVGTCLRAVTAGDVVHLRALSCAGPRRRGRRPGG